MPPMRFFCGKTPRKGYMRTYLETAESVTEGHPDKMCDKIVATALDNAIESSAPLGIRPRVALQAGAKGHERGGSLLLFGEVTLPKGVTLDYETIARSVIRDIGYTDPSYGFYDGMEDVRILLTEQSVDIDKAVSHKKARAGDQGIMISGAFSGDGPELMPMPIMIAHALTNKLTQVFKSSELPYLRPDGKSQVVIRYQNGKPVSVEEVTIAASHDYHVEKGQLREDIYKKVVEPTLDPLNFWISMEQLIVNGFHSAFGPTADAGADNRKIVIDQMGGRCPVGGGGLNGKDPTKVDFSGAMAARYVAKALVANNLAGRVQLEVSYSLGQPDPRSVNIKTFGSRARGITEGELYKFQEKILPLSVSEIIDRLDLFQPRFASAAVGGFFGRSEFPWEQVPKIR